IHAIRMVKDQRTHARLRLHHHAFGQTHADLLWMQQLPDPLLIVKVLTRAVSEAVPLATIARGKALLHRHRRRIRKAPVLANATVQPFGGRLGSLDGQSLESVGFEILSGILRRFRSLTNVLAGGRNKDGDVIAAALFGVKNIITQAEAILPQLPPKVKSMN